MVSVLGVAQLFAVVGAIVAALVFSGAPDGRDLGLGAAGGRAQRRRARRALPGARTRAHGDRGAGDRGRRRCVPVVYGLATGERPSALALVGVALAVGAGGLIAREHDTDASGSARRALLLAIGAGLLFGWSFVLYAETAHDSGFWPALSGRAAAVVIVVAVALVSGAGLRLPPPERRLAVAAGVLDIGATVMLLVAVREDLSSLVAPVAALGPTFTVAWAWAVLREPVARLQVAGLGVALVGLVLIAAG